MAKICCVCGGEAPAFKKYAGRDYCERCLDRITSSRRTFLRSSGIIEILSLLIVVSIAGIVGRLFDVQANPTLRLLLSVVFALAVSLVFLILFYRQDRLEPEPVSYIALMFLAGGALALLVVEPLLELLFTYSAWENHGFLLNFLGHIFVVGIMMELGKLLLVRYSIYMNREFDEIVDGVVYMSVVGLGYATALNLRTVFSTGGVDLLNGTIRMATLALMHASISGLIGFFLGKARFEAGNRFGLAFSLVVGSVLWGLYYYLTHLAITGVRFNPWIELVVAALFAFAVMSLTVGLMNRTIRHVEQMATEGGS